MRWLFCLFLFVVTACPAYCDVRAEMVQVSDSVFSGNGTPDLIAWENFTMQLTPEMDPVDIASLFKPESKASNEQRQAAQMVFLKSQGAAALLERGGKTVTQFLMGKGFTMSMSEHEFNPALFFFKPGEPTRRFDFVRQGGKLKLARVSLTKPTQND